jgi:hypothetical protein
MGGGAVAGPILGGMVAVQGWLEPEAGQTLAAALEPGPPQPTPPMGAAGTSAAPMPWLSWPAGPWRTVSCPRPAASAPN